MSWLVVESDDAPGLEQYGGSIVVSDVSRSSVHFQLALSGPHGDHCLGALKDLLPGVRIITEITLAANVQEEDAIRAFGRNYTHRFRWSE